MVKIGIFPIRWVMTGFTVCTILTVVNIVLSVAGVAVLRCRLQVCDGARIEMAFCTSDISMLAFQFESIGIVIEIIEAIYTIMARHTVGSIGEHMSLGEGNVHVAVAGLAGVRGEG